MHRKGIKSQAGDVLFRLETGKTDYTRLLDNFLELVVSLVQHIQQPNDTQDSSSADKYCVCEICDFMVREPQNDLAKVVALMGTNITLMATEEAPKFIKTLYGTSCRYQLSSCHAKIEQTALCYSYDRDSILIMTAQIDGAS